METTNITLKNGEVNRKKFTSHIDSYSKTFSFYDKVVLQIVLFTFNYNKISDIAIDMCTLYEKEKDPYFARKKLEENLNLKSRKKFGFFYSFWSIICRPFIVDGTQVFKRIETKAMKELEEVGSTKDKLDFYIEKSNYFNCMSKTEKEDLTQDELNDIEYVNTKIRNYEVENHLSQTAYDLSILPTIQFIGTEFDLDLIAGQLVRLRKIDSTKEFIEIFNNINISDERKKIVWRGTSGQLVYLFRGLIPIKFPFELII